MLALLKKEIGSFFNSISGYIVIIIFLVLNGLIIWVFPGVLNILDSGNASLSSYFTIAPWIFLFLVPAITMRMFSEESRTGTIEFILTKPISELNIVLAKYFATIVLVALSILPTLIYFISVYNLGNPVGNIDSGATWGAFIGLFFLAASYGAIGIYSSVITENQIVAFLAGITICFILFMGFESIGGLGIFQTKANFIIYLGIYEHYKSMSRGVIDSRDLVYFLSIILVFILLTRNKLNARKK